MCPPSSERRVCCGQAIATASSNSVPAAMIGFADTIASFLTVWLPGVEIKNMASAWLVTRKI
jgi:hypothetical protein